MIAKISDKDRDTVLRLKQNGLSHAKIGEIYEVSGSRVGQILKGMTPSDMRRERIADAHRRLEEMDAVYLRSCGITTERLAMLAETGTAIVEGWLEDKGHPKHMKLRRRRASNP